MTTLAAAVNLVLVSAFCRDDSGKGARRRLPSVLPLLGCAVAHNEAVVLRTCAAGCRTLVAAAYRASPSGPRRLGEQASDVVTAANRSAGLQWAARAAKMTVRVVSIVLRTNPRPRPPVPSTRPRMSKRLCGPTKRHAEEPADELPGRPAAGKLACRCRAAVSARSRPDRSGRGRAGNTSTGSDRSRCAGAVPALFPSHASRGLDDEKRGAGRRRRRCPISPP